MDHVRNLGFIMDSLLKNGSHVNKITSSCYCKLCDIARIRPSLDTKSAQPNSPSPCVIHIDYCNSLLAGCLQYQLDKLQHIQNMSCWVICNVRKHDHVSSSMKNLHWLKIPERITYNCVSCCISAKIILHLNICPICFNLGPPVDCCDPHSLTIFM